jgi:hypothetical protein
MALWSMDNDAEITLPNKGWEIAFACGQREVMH